MRPQMNSVRKHDDLDLGFLKPKGVVLSHWYRSTAHSTLAISHCLLVHAKNELVDVANPARCFYCSMIEELRGQNDTNDKSHL